MIDLTVTLPRQFAEGHGQLNVNITLPDRSLTALVGPSGSGKTTLLRVLAGLEKPVQGRVVVDGQPWFDGEKRINLPPQQRSIGYVFQDAALFPNLTVRENIAYAAPRTGQTQIDELIDATGLTTLIHARPDRLSGGQRQRVALARALVRRPRLLLLDEPFSALDTDAGDQLRHLLLTLHRAWGTTTLLVSHHLTDVRALADQVLYLAQGQLLPSPPPTPAYPSPTAQPIRRVWYDTAQQHWVIDTDTLQLRSANPQWATLQPGALIDVTLP